MEQHMDEDLKKRIDQLEDENRQLRNVEINLREQERKLNTLIHNIPGIVYRCNNDKDWTIEYINPGSKEVTGYPATDFINNSKRTYADIIHPDDQNYVWDEIQKAINHRKSYKFEYRIIHQDGNPKWVFEKGRGIFDEQEQLIALEGIVIDINDRKLAEKAHQQSEARFKGILTSMDDLVFTFDRNKRFTYCHFPSEERLLVPPEEFIGKYHDEVMPAHVSKLFNNAFEKIKTDKAVSFEYEMKIHNKSHWYSVHISPILSDKKFKGAVAVVRDITKTKESEFIQKELASINKNILKTTLDGFIMVDAKGQIIEVNDSYCSTIGYSREELLAKNIRDVESELSEEQIKDRINKMLNDGSVRFETQHIHKTGKVLSLDVSISVMMVKNESMINAFVRDITEQKKAQQALEDAYYWLKESQKISRIGNYILDITTGNWTSSEILDEIFGISQDYVRDVDGWSTVVHPDDRQMMLDYYLKNVIENKKPFDKEYRIQKVDSLKMRWVHGLGRLQLDHEGLPVKMIGTIRDITEKKEAEIQLKELSTRLELAVDSADIGIWDWNIKDNDMIWDDRMFEIYELKKGNSYDHFSNWKNIIHPESAQSVEQNMKHALQKGDYTIDEFRIVMPDGRIKHIKMYALIVRDSDMKAIRMVGINMDISQEKEREQEIKLLNEQLEERVQLRTTELLQANKDLEAFAYSVSHDLRSPLRHIEGFARILHNTSDKENRSDQRYFNKIFESSDKMQQLINDLLTFSRLGRKELKMVKVDLNYLLKDVIADFEEETRSRDIVWKTSDLPFVKGDPSLLKMVFTNLVSNAVKFTSMKSQAQIEIGSVLLSQHKPQIFVKDNGVGFDMRFVDKLFGVFQRLHSEEQFPGTGIGLANVKRIIHRHKGEIQALGEVDRGATFFITLNPYTK